MILYVNYYHCRHGFCTNERILSNPYFLYVYSGKGLFRINDTIYEANSKDLFFCPANVPNMISADKRDPFVLTGIDFECDIGEGIFAPLTDLSTDSGHEELLREMIRSFSYPGNISIEYCNALLKAFMMNVVYFRHNEKIMPDSKDRIMKYLTDNSCVSATIQKAGRLFNYHPATINRMVRSTTGMSAKEFQIDSRIKKAKGLLLYSDRSVTDIAAECGYKDVFFFSRQLKKKTGVSPSELRI